MNRIELIESRQSLSRAALKARLSDYAQLFKLRLTSLVVFSTFVGYFISTGNSANWWLLFPLLIGGFLTVASANALNQVIERRTDRLMKRTLNRPVATNRMPVSEAVFAAVITGIAGVLLIGLYLNQLSALLAFAGLVVYAFMYTPLKRVSEFSVWVGAIAGAIPPLVGVAAASGSLNTTAWVLFTLQFFWQFPHFYAIAWLLHDDYKKAGLRLMPFGGRKDSLSTVQISALTLVLVPAGFIPFILGSGSLLLSVALAVAGCYLFMKSLNLHQSKDDKTAKKLMFASFLYLPLILFSYMIESMIL